MEFPVACALQASGDGDIDINGLTSIVDGHEHAFAHIGAEIDERVVIDIEWQIVAELEGDVLTTLLGETTNFVEVVLLEVIVGYNRRRSRYSRTSTSRSTTERRLASLV